MGIDEILAAIHRPEKTVPICLRGDLHAVFEQLERDFIKADTAITDDVTTTGASAEAVKLGQRMEEIRGEMRDATEIFTLRALPRTEWVALAQAHPQRPGIDTGDVNEETFTLALVAACCIDPEMTVEQALLLHGELSEGQWMSLASAAWNLNREVQDVPFSLAASSRAASALFD